MASADLGATLMHEHLYTLYADYRSDYGWDRYGAIDRAVEAMQELLRVGISAIVDMTVLGLGRSVEMLAEVSRRSGMTIVGATGIYTFSDLPGFFKNRTQYVSADFIADFLTEELTHGVADTGIRPAVLKLATDHQGVTDDVRLITEQVALAHHRTGAPISTHAHAASRQGLTQQSLLREAGVDLGRVVIGHAGDSADLDYLLPLLDAGSWIGMDRFGHEPSQTLEVRIDTVARLCARGYASQMVLSHDTNVSTDSLPEDVRHSPLFENWHYLCIPQVVIPELRRRGVSEAEIELMMITNPRRILENR